MYCRCRLWAGLAKLSRKHKVWDVAFIASKFGLMYDDKRWTGNAICLCTSYYDVVAVEAAKIDEKLSKTGSRKKLQKSSSLSVNRSSSSTTSHAPSSVTGLAGLSGPAEEREAGRKRGRERLCGDLLRTLAEMHFIHAEVQ